MRSTRLSRRAALAVGLSIVAIMVVWSPMLALANSSDNAADQSSVETAPGLTGEAGDSAAAPDQETEEVEVTETETETETLTASVVDDSDDSEESRTETFSNAGGNGPPTTPPGNGDGPGTGQGGNDCDGGSEGNGNGANTSGDFDNTCDDVDENVPAPNGNGNGGAGGKPCEGCVGNADDKNPPGQSNGDNNNGYECEPDDGQPGNGNGSNNGNNGVGGGNPAHTGCDDEDDPGGCTDPDGCENKVEICHRTNGNNPWVIIEVSENALQTHLDHGDSLAPTSGDAADCGTPPPPCDDGEGGSEWSLTVTLGQTVASASHQSQTFSTEPADITVTFTAAAGYNTTGLPGGATTATDTATFSDTKCSDTVSYTFTRIQSGSDCESWGLTATVTNGTISAPSEMSDGYHDFDSSTPQSVTFTAAEGYSSDGTATGATSVTKTAGAYSAFPSCAASVSMVFSEIGGEVLDCDEDGIEDSVDPDTSSCDPDEPEEPELCPDGLPPDENGQCVRGIIITRPPDKDEDPSVPDVADKTLGAPEAPSVLPFTGGNLLPFLMLSLGLIGTGGVAAMKGRKRA